ncbi:MAG: OmpA family protein [Bacteroidales bacterium]
MKNKKLILILLTLVGITHLQSQTIQNTLKQIRSKKYDEAAPFLLSAESFANRNTEVLYALSLFYSAPTNYQNLAKAAYYFRDASLAFYQTPVKEKKELKNEFKIDEEALLKTENQLAKNIYKYFAKEGDLYSLREFYKIFPNYQVYETRGKKDWEIAEEGEKLRLEEGYKPELEKTYRSFIKKSGPKEIAMTALQVLAGSRIIKRDWEGAVAIFEKYRSEFPPEDYRVDKIISLLRENLPEPNIVSISPRINSSGDNYAPVLSADEKTIYFCGRNRKDNLGNEDIFSSAFENGEWSKPVLVKGLNRKKENEAPLAISPDNKILITYKKGDLWFSSANSEKGWNEPKPINSINTPEFTEIDATFSADGKVMLFASDREGNLGTFHHMGEKFNGSYMGNLDIYLSKRINDSTWSKPVNLGKSINTNLCERSPYLHPDGKTLYFSSAGHGSLGRLDVFKSTRLSDTSWTRWSEPVNLGKTLNTIDDDFDYKFTADGKKAIFTTTDKGRIYITVINLPERKKITSTRLLVNVTDSLTGKPLVSSVVIKNSTDKSAISNGKTNNAGWMATKIPAEKQISIVAEAPDYYVSTDVFDTYNLRDTAQITRYLRLSPKNILQVNMDEVEDHPVTITLKNILFDYNLADLKAESFPELDKLVNFLKLYPDVYIIISGHTDNTGEKDYNKKLSARRANSVKNYLVKKGCYESHLRTAGYGDERPVDTNDTDEGRENNRRVELSISMEGFAE